MIYMKEATVAYIDSKQLRDAFPDLYRAYEDIFKGKRPKIEVKVKSEYHFNPSISDSMSDYYNNVKYFFLRNGDIKSFDCGSSQNPNIRINTTFDMQDGDAVMECYYRNIFVCILVVNPSFMNQQALPSRDNSDLDLAEQFVLLIIKSTNSTYRMKEFKHPYTSSINDRVKTNATGWDADPKELKKSIITYTTPENKTYEYAWLAISKSLERKGYAKVNSAGSVQLTLSGKNKSMAITGSSY